MSNTGKMFSIVIPTRERLVGLKKTLDSFQNMTDNLNELEVLLVCDKDDPTLPKLQELMDKYPYDLMALVRDRSKMFCRDYYNWGAAKTKGQNIMCFNDDCYITTPHWDTIIKEKVGARKVYTVDLWDSTHEGNGHSFPRFPMMSRAAYEATGQFYYPQITMWGADTLIHCLYQAADVIIPCHEVFLQHDHLPSKTFYDAFEEDRKNGVFPIDVRPELQKLRKAMEELDGIKSRREVDTTKV